jgi:hypothetical protein
VTYYQRHKEARKAYQNNRSLYIEKRQMINVQISYQFSITPNAVFDGNTVNYFKAHHFDTAQLVVSDQSNPAAAINALKAAGFAVVVDIEQVIWAGGQVTAPLSNFAGYFQMLKNAGVEYVSSEGGRSGDLDILKQYFKGYMNYNCDQCGLWKDFYSHPFTVWNSWESYYDSEWQYIQQGCRAGKKNGILAGCWTYGNPILSNSQAGTGLTYMAMADWMAANGGLDHFAIWAGINDNMLSQYKALGFEGIVAAMQAKYPPRGTGPAPVSTITPASCISEITLVNKMRYEFITGSDQACWYRTIDTTGKASAFTSLGGKCIAAPKAVALPDGSLRVYVIGTTTSVFEKAMTAAGVWSADWKNLGGLTPKGSSLEAVAYAMNNLVVYVLGTNGSEYTNTWGGTAWSGWTSYIAKLA